MMTSITLKTGNFSNASILEFAPRSDGNVTNTNASDTAEGTLLFSPGIYYFIGTLMIIIMVTGFSTNLAILYTYATNRKIRTVDNTLIIGLALSDIGQAIFGIPFVAVSSFSKQWIFGHAVCQYYAFITTCFGIAQISMLTVIAMERYFVIVKHDRRLTNTPCRCVIIILCSFIYGSCWATGPLLGWSGYKEEEIGIACCVKWEIKDGMAISYTISICTFGWFIPLFLIAFGYISIACSIYNERNKKQHLRRKVLPSKNNRERKVAITVLIMIGAFIISWTPYSAVSLWSAVGDFHSIPLWVQVAPAVFAKCSIIWNPLIYVARHENFRNGVKNSLSYLKFWNRKYNNNIRSRINSKQPSTRQYKEIETTNINSCVRQSVTSDNYVTYMEGPARSNSSVPAFRYGPSTFKRQRIRKYFTLFSTLYTSPNLEEEKSESNSIESVKNVVPCETKSIQTDKVIVYNPPGCLKDLSDKYVQTDLSHTHSVTDFKKEDYASGKDIVPQNNSGTENASKPWATEMHNQLFIKTPKDEIHGTNILLVAQVHSFENNSNTITSIDDLESKRAGLHSPIITNLNEEFRIRMNSVAERNRSTEESKNNEVVSLEEKTSPSRMLDLEKTRSLEILKEKRKLLKQKLEIIYHDSQSCDAYQSCDAHQSVDAYQYVDAYQALRDKDDSTKIKDYSLVSQTMYKAPTIENNFTRKQYLMNKMNEGCNATPTLIDIRNSKQRKLVASMSQRSKDEVPKPSNVKKREKYRTKLTHSRNANDSAGIEMRTHIYKPMAQSLQLQEIEDNTLAKVYGTQVRFTDNYEKATVIRQSTV